MKKKAITAVAAVCAIWAANSPIHAVVYDTEYLLQHQFGAALGKVSAAERSAAIEAVASKLQPGDALLLPRSVALGDVDLSGIPDEVTIQYGRDGRIFLGGRHSGLRVMQVEAELIGLSKAAHNSGNTDASDSWVTDSYFEAVANIINSNQNNNHYVEVKAGNGAKVIDLVGKTFTNSSAVWVWYSNNHLSNQCNGPFVRMSNVDATGSRIYGIIEHNYCIICASVEFDNVRGLTYGVGDTEGSESSEGAYIFKGNTDFNFVSHRNFHSHGTGRCPDITGMAYQVTGNKGLHFYATADIGDNGPFSMIASGNTNTAFFGSFFEEPIKMSNNTNTAKIFFTPNGFGNTPVTQWKEPVSIDEEIILDYDGFTIDPGTSKANKPSDFTLPEPRTLPSLENKNFLPSGALSKKSVHWGSEALALGADPTGSQASHEVFQRLILQKNFVEMPQGTFLFGKTVEMPCRPGNKVTFSGIGKTYTRIITSGNFPPFNAALCDEAGSLAKSGATGEVQRGSNVLTDMTLDGRNASDFGDVFKQSGYSSCTTIGCSGGGQTVQRRNVEYTKFVKAGIVVGTGTLDVNAVGSWDGHDQCRFVRCTFSGSEYGIFNNNGMVDKQLYHGNTFKNLSKGGLWIVGSHMVEASTISANRFENIGGAAIRMGHNRGNGYHPGPAAMMDNEIIECGNKQEAAVEWSYMRQGLVLNNKIVIKNKEWKWGFRGTGQVIQGLVVDVDKSKMASGGAGIALRHPRHSKNNRLTGNIVSRSWSSAPLVFINDVASYEKAPMPSGAVDYTYAYTNLIHNSSFDNGNQKYDYVMVRTDKSGAIKEQIAFEGEAPTVKVIHETAPLTSQNSRWSLFDARGQKVHEGALEAAVLRSQGIQPGIYYARPLDAPEARLRAVPVF